MYPHGIGLPFLRPGDTNRTLLKNFPPPEPDARVVLADALATLKKRSASPHDRAVSLCVTLHLFGDLHQPLHTATLLTKNKPRGYNLGGDFIIRTAAGEKSNLHTFWDHLPGEDSSHQSILALANSLAAATELRPDTLPEYQQHKSIPAWVQETFETAVRYAYAEDRIRLVDQRTITSKSLPDSAAPVVSAEYVELSQKVMRRCLALAALRLGDELKQVPWE